MHPINTQTNLRVAVIHDWLTVKGGAEKALQAILEIYPKADLYTVVDTLPQKHRSWLKGHKVIPCDNWVLRLFPQQYRYFLPFMPRWVEKINLDGYDLIISSSHSVAKGVICHPDQLHIAYIYSPMRHAWDMQWEHIDNGFFGKGIKAWLIKCWLHKFRIWDTCSFLRPDYLIATSHFIQRRISKVCNRQAPVIYPPVDPLQRVAQKVPEKDYYLMVVRMVPYKRVDIVVEAFQQMPDKKLILIGEGPLLDKLRKQAETYPNIDFKGYLADNEMIAYLQSAKAFIHMAKEDFGIAPLEAQSLGIPVIAYGQGGAKETVVDLTVNQRATGILFHQQNSEALKETVDIFEEQGSKINSKDCIENAKKFSKQNFQTELSKMVNSWASNG